MDAPLKYHGGKHYLAPRIVELMPPHLHYVEPFAGGLSVMLATDPNGRSEVVNDIDFRLSNFWKFLASRLFDEFKREIDAIPFSETAYIKAANHQYGVCKELSGEFGRPCLTCAVAYFIHCRQSLAGRMSHFTPLSRNRVRRGMNEQVSAWLTSIEGLPAVHARMIRVVVLCHDGIDVIRQQDGEETFFYLDPPYLAETRTSPDVYKHEMTEDDHIRLLNTLSGIRGKFLLSGYDSPLYTSFATKRNWITEKILAPNHSAGGVTKRTMTEIIFRNYS